MFPVIVTLNTPAQLNAVLAALKFPLDDAPIPFGETQEIHANPVAIEVPKAPTPEAAPLVVDSAPAPAEAQTPKVIRYEEVARAITEAAKTNRAHAVATLAKFQAAKGIELKPEQYADFLAALAAEV